MQTINLIDFQNTRSGNEGGEIAEKNITCVSGLC